MDLSRFSSERPEDKSSPDGDDAQKRHRKHSSPFPRSLGSILTSASHVLSPLCSRSRQNALRWMEFEWCLQTPLRPRACPAPASAVRSQPSVASSRSELSSAAQWPLSPKAMPSPGQCIIGRGGRRAGLKIRPFQAKREPRAVSRAPAGLADVIIERALHSVQLPPLPDPSSFPRCWPKDTEDTA